MTSSVWDVVKVPFPYTNRDTQQRRPALVVACHSGEGMPDLLWIVMITSAEHRIWPGDISISNLRSAGLPVASLIRPTKIATIEAGSVDKIGQLERFERSAVKAFLSHLF